MKSIINIFILLSAFAVVGCQSSPDGDHAHDHDHDHPEVMEAHADSPAADAEEHDEIHLRPEQMELMDIQLGRFDSLSLNSSVKSNGRLELPPQNKASVSPVMAGRVTRILVLPGNTVRAGQTLAMLEHPDFLQMQEQYMRIKSSLPALEADFIRKKGLYADSISSARDYQLAEAAYRQAQAEVNGLRARLEMLDLNPAEAEVGNFSTAVPLRSPISGSVHRIEVNLGKYVLPEQELFQIVDNDHIHIDLLVYEKDFTRIRVGQQVAFSLNNNPEKRYRGRVFSVGKSFEEEPKAVMVHAEIENKEGELLPGMYVNAHIITDAKQVSALPDDAVISQGGLDFIYVLEEEAADEWHFRPVEVRTGTREMGFVEVQALEPLPADARIVTQGAYYLFAESKKGEGGHGHEH